jgi:hypothetical protein
MSNKTKLKEDTEARPEKAAKLDEDKFLDGLHIYLHPAALSATRKNIFERQIQIRGGILVKDLSISNDNDNVVVVIDNSNVEPGKLRSLIEKCLQANPNYDLVFVGSNWLSGCLEAKRRLKFEQFDLKAKCGKLTTVKPSPGAAVEAPKAKSEPSPKTVSASKFVCAHSSVNPVSTNFNEAITRELEKLAQTYKSSNDR